MDNETFVTRISRAWNAFLNRSEQFVRSIYEGGGSGSNPGRSRASASNERSIVSSVYTKMALDISSLRIQHVVVDENEQYEDSYDSGLNDCLTLSANIDQTGASFIRDVVVSLFDEGAIAIVPVDTTDDPTHTNAYDVKSLRVGKIVQWYPRSVRVELYNDNTGNREELTLPKTTVAVVENPLYNIMNLPNSTLKRLVRKLNLLDAIDEQSGSGKLDLIIQLPYIIKSEARKKQAEERRKDIEDQLRGSERGIAYTDGTEKVIQLNRPAENNLMVQIEYLTSMLYSQLGITESVLDGTADEATMLNYLRRTIEPVAQEIVTSMERTFLSKTARTQGQRLMLFSDPFKLVPLAQIAEIADKFTRNEVASGNDIRGIIGLKPSKDPTANELRNKNIRPPSSEATPVQPSLPEGGVV